MSRTELIEWAKAHAEGTMVSPVAVAVLALVEDHANDVVKCSDRLVELALKYEQALSEKAR